MKTVHNKNVVLFPSPPSPHVFPSLFCRFPHPHPMQSPHSPTPPTFVLLSIVCFSERERDTDTATPRPKRCVDGELSKRCHAAAQGEPSRPNSLTMSTWQERRGPDRRLWAWGEHGARRRAECTPFRICREISPASLSLSLPSSTRIVLNGPRVL